MAWLPLWVLPTASRAGASDITRDEKVHVFSRVGEWEQIPLEEDVGRKAIIYISKLKHPSSENDRNRVAPQ